MYTPTTIYMSINNTPRLLCLAEGCDREATMLVLETTGHSRNTLFAEPFCTDHEDMLRNGERVPLKRDIQFRLAPR